MNVKLDFAFSQYEYKHLQSILIELLGSSHYIHLQHALENVSINQTPYAFKSLPVTKHEDQNISIRSDNQDVY